MRRAVILFSIAFAGAVFADGARDPMRPPAPMRAIATAATEEKPVLSAIIGANGDLIAIVNGHCVRKGESVGTYVIETVFVNGIRYRHAGVIQDLFLPHIDRIKTPSTAAIAAHTPMGVN